MTKNILIAAFPGNFGLEREYAAVNVTIILMTTLDIVSVSYTHLFVSKFDGMNIDQYVSTYQEAIDGMDLE